MLANDDLHSLPARRVDRERAVRDECPAVLLEPVEDAAECRERLVAPHVGMPLEHDVVARALRGVLRGERRGLHDADAALEVACASERELALGLLHVAVEPRLDLLVLAQKPARFVRDEPARRAESVEDEPRLLPEHALRLVEVRLLVVVVGDPVLREVRLAVRPLYVHRVGPSVLPVVEEPSIGAGVRLKPLDILRVAPLERLANDAERSRYSALLEVLGHL